MTPIKLKPKSSQVKMRNGKLIVQEGAGGEEGNFDISVRATKTIKREEANLQSACIKQFRQLVPVEVAFPVYVPNGHGYSNVVSQVQARNMGLVKGTADIIIFGKTGTLFVEFKTREKYSKLRVEQKHMRRVLFSQGYRTCVVRDVHGFGQIIDYYIALTKAIKDGGHFTKLEDYKFPDLGCSATYKGLILKNSPDINDFYK